MANRNRREALLPLLAAEQQGRSSTGRQRSSSSPMLRRSASGSIKVRRTMRFVRCAVHRSARRAILCKRCFT
jgi:hypothetical protein